MAAHPKQNLLAAGHDSGMIVYKLERERPAQAVHDGCIYYIKDKNVRCFTVDSTADVPMVQLRRRDVTAAPPRQPRSHAAIATGKTLVRGLNLETATALDTPSEWSDTPARL